MEASDAAAALLLLMGLWTPIVGALVVLLELWIAFTYGGDIRAYQLTAAIAAGLSLIGPGAFSIDALVFGRKRITIHDL